MARRPHRVPQHMGKEPREIRRGTRQQTQRDEPRGNKPKQQEEGPRPKDQYNFNDPESRIMKSGSGFEQSYNAQAAVEVDAMRVVGLARHSCPQTLPENLKPSKSPPMGSNPQIHARLIRAEKLDFTEMKPDRLLGNFLSTGGDVRTYAPIVEALISGAS